jgi:hypothetical protein
MDFIKELFDDLIFSDLINDTLDLYVNNFDKLTIIGKILLYPFLFIIITFVSIVSIFLFFICKILLFIYLRFHLNKLSFITSGIKKIFFKRIV